MLSTMPLWDHPWPLLQWGVVVGAALIGAASDIRTQTIPNRLSATVWLTGVLAAAWYFGVSGCLDAGLGCLVLAFPFVLLFVLGVGGAGDAKLLGALGAWLGLLNATLALIAVLVTGALCGLAYAAAKRQLGPVLRRTAGLALRWAAILAMPGMPRSLAVAPDEEEAFEVMPYGVSILSGVCVAALSVFLWRLRS